MKKSTIFLLALVYIISFLVVGIFGISVRSFDAVSYADMVKVEVAATQLADVNPTIPKGMVADENEERHYTCLIRYNYIEKSVDGEIKCVVRLKATALSNMSLASNQELRMEKNEEASVADVTQEDNAYFNVSFNKKGSYTFAIYSTDGYGAYTTVKLMYYTN